MVLENLPSEIHLGILLVMRNEQVIDAATRVEPGQLTCQLQIMGITWL